MAAPQLPARLETTFLGLSPEVGPFIFEYALAEGNNLEDYCYQCTQDGDCEKTLH
jgi:hypothetical protein